MSTTNSEIACPRCLKFSGSDEERAKDRRRAQCILFAEELVTQNIVTKGEEFNQFWNGYKDAVSCEPGLSSAELREKDVVQTKTLREETNFKGETISYKYLGQFGELFKHWRFGLLSFKYLRKHHQLLKQIPLIRKILAAF
jgi:hypothetical protein